MAHLDELRNARFELEQIARDLRRANDEQKRHDKLITRNAYIYGFLIGLLGSVLLQFIRLWMIGN